MVPRRDVAGQPEPERVARRAPGENMSQQANKLLKELLEERPDGIPWDEAVEEVKTTCGVKENTAETYIRRSEHASKELTIDGDKMVVQPGSGETIIHDEDKITGIEVGDPTSSKFGELTILEDIGHPEVPKEHEEGYYRRRMADDDSELSRKTDVQVVTSTMALEDFSTLLIGKHGVGKDKLVLHICAKTNRPTVRLVANDDPDFVDLLVGTFTPNEDGDFVHKKGLLSIAMEKGYTFILDEFNALSGKVQTMLNKILEESGKNQLLIPETNQVINPHPEFKFVATQNPNEIGYGGREEIDAATGSRFVPVEIPPLDEETEKKVVAANTGWSENSKELDLLLRPDGGVFRGIRALHDQGKISTWVSTRDAIQIGQMAEKLGSTQAAADLVLSGRADPEDRDPIRSAILDNNWP